MSLDRLLITGLLGASAVLGGCRGDRSDDPPRRFFPSLDYQQRWDPQEETDFYADGRVLREPPIGTVPFGWSSNAGDPRREAFLREDEAVYRGIGPDGEYLAMAPVAKLMAAGDASPAELTDVIRRGRERYDIYCLPCHGGTGRGDGIVGRRWSYPLPNFHDPQYQPGGEKGDDGYIFHVIRNGVANAPGQQPALRMPAYAESVSEREAWAIVLYIRAMQRAQSGDLQDVPEAERQRLLRERGAAGAADAGDAMGTSTEGSPS
jgi:mono/diheme cytochrome c family protein